MADKHGKKTLQDDANPMPAEAFREWRKRLGLKQKEAADLLGLKKRMIQYYETGSRSGKHVSIPKSIRLACFALEAGVRDYDGENVLGEAPFARRLGGVASTQSLSAAAFFAADAAPGELPNGRSGPPPLPPGEPNDN